MAALAALALLAWHLTRPALWLDESATVIATQRTWPHLWQLLSGADAPLVPFYALLKASDHIVVALVPRAAAHPELLFRWPSVLAAVAAVWVLTVWLTRYLPVPVVVAVDVILLSTAGLSRYGQEARPYAFILLFTVACTFVWTRVAEDGRKRWVALYALAVVLLITSNSLAATLVLAHAIAAVAAVPAEKRWPALLRTAVGGGIGILLAAPVALNATARGKGATAYPPLNVANLSATFMHLFTTSDHRFPWTGLLLPFAIVGLYKVFSSEYTFIARLAAAWALVPPGILLPALLVKPNLLIGRYLMFVVPAWAILGGLGVLTVFELLRRASGWRLVSALVTAALLAGAVVSQIETLDLQREFGGHGEDMRWAMASANARAYGKLPIVTSSRLGTVEFAAYGRADESRLVNFQVQRDRKEIWPEPVPSNIRNDRLRVSRRLVLMMRVSADSHCGTDSMETDVAAIERCMPSFLRRWNYHVTRFDRRGRNWTFAILQRPPRTLKAKPAAAPATKAKKSVTTAKHAKKAIPTQ